MGTNHDILSSTLQYLRICGTVLLRESYAPPWMLTIPHSGEMGKLLQKEPETHIVAFHFVEKGFCSIVMENDSGEIETRIQAGELAICFSGGAHRLKMGHTMQSIGLEHLLGGNRNIFHSRGTAPENSTSLTCGVFMLHDTGLNPLFAALPPLLHTSVTLPGHSHNLSGIMELLQREIGRQAIGGSYVLERFLEVLCAEVIRAHAETVSENVGNWLGGIRDPIIGDAVARIHTDPAQDWTVASLATIVAMSPSRFAARFVAALGEPPMTYVTKWRMNVASLLLSSSQREITQIAAEVGYENVPAFHRAFKRYTGIPPAEFRLRRKMINPIK